MGSQASIFWWNVHSLQDAAHAERVVTKLKGIDPDIFGLGEVVGEPAYKFIAREFPEHNFYMTYGRESQEILVGVRRTLPVFFSQKTEFQSGNSFVRPAVLATINDSESPLNILFVHPKSYPSPKDFGQRDDFFQRVFDLKRLLDIKAGGDARFIVCGDMNIMGMSYLERDFITPEDEFHHISTEGGNVGLLFMEKSARATWAANNKGSQSADLDHVLASQAVKFRSLTTTSGNSYDITVGGWVDFPKNSKEREAFIAEASDHCFLSFQVVLGA